MSWDIPKIIQKTKMRTETSLSCRMGNIQRLVLLYHLSVFDKIDGLEVVREEPVLGESIAQIWNMGLRPLFNPLVKMANAIDPEYRTEVKQEWCLILEEMFSEYVATYECTHEEAFEFLYVLEKQPS